MSGAWSSAQQYLSSNTFITIEDAENGYTARDDTKLPQGTIQKKVQSSLKTIILNDMMAIYGFSTHQGVAIIYG